MHHCKNRKQASILHLPSHKLESIHQTLHTDQGWFVTLVPVILRRDHVYGTLGLGLLQEVHETTVSLFEVVRKVHIHFGRLVCPWPVPANHKTFLATLNL